MGLTTFSGSQPTLKEAVVAKNYLNEKELRAMGQLVSGYLDFAERQAEREQAMTMQDWSEHLDRILTMSGEQLLIGNGSVSHKQAIDKATGEYRKYKARTLSEVERDYLDSIKLLEQKTDKSKPGWRRCDEKERIKVYIYTRVSTAMQIDGYSLDAQKSRMKAFADFNDYEIVGEYEDAGKSGKSIEGRIQFNQMMEDIKSGKDGVSYVLVFKLSRFGRNAADVLSTLQVMQDFGVNLICVEDGIDSSKDAGKLMISVLSAVAEIERENIRVQTMEGRIQKAREGKWNGGFAPYGYKLEKGQLFINEEEAAAIRVIFDQYVHTDTGANGLAKYLVTHGIHKIQRQNGKNPLFDSALIRRILKNPVYCGKSPMADAERRRCMAQEMITVLWSRMTICWWMVCMRESFPKNYGTRRRSSC